MLCSGAIGVLRYTCGMFIKLTRSKSRTYAQLVESFRDEQGQPRQRTVATLGRVDEDGGTVDAVLRTLLRAKGRSGVDITGINVTHAMGIPALGMVAAGEGICIVPESVKMMQFRHVNYLPLADSAAVSPIYLIVRNDDEGQYTRPLFDCVYQVYDLEAIEYDRRVF